MRVEHLSCAAMHPILVGALPAHVLLVHTADGLVLVDTGFGLQDLAEPRKRLGSSVVMLRPDRSERHTAIRQLEAAGYSAADVAHIVLTHLDLDHAGGLPDFPEATVHTTTAEHAAATHPSMREAQRYRPAHVQHGAKFQLHEGRGDTWLHGLTGHEVLAGITLIPMPGHTRGHAAVAVETEDRGMIVHAGDAIFDGTSANIPHARESRLLRVFEQAMAMDRKKIAENHQTLARLQAEGMTVIPAHDRGVYEAMAPYRLGI